MGKSLLNSLHFPWFRVSYYLEIGSVQRESSALTELYCDTSEFILLIYSPHNICSHLPNPVHLPRVCMKTALNVIYKFLHRRGALIFPLAGDAETTVSIDQACNCRPILNFTRSLKSSVSVFAFDPACYFNGIRLSRAVGDCTHLYFQAEARTVY